MGKGLRLVNRHQFFCLYLHFHAGPVAIAQRERSTLFLAKGVADREAKPEVVIFRVFFVKRPCGGAEGFF